MALTGLPPDIGSVRGFGPTGGDGFNGGTGAGCVAGACPGAIIGPDVIG